MLQLKVLLDDDGYVSSWCSTGDIEGSVDATLPDDGRQHFVTNCFDYKPSPGGVLQHDASKPAPLVPYRLARKSRYIEELSDEGTFETTVGDTLDAIIKAVYGDTTELDELAAKINAIKADIPAT